MADVGGYAYEFVGEVDNDYICPICRLVLREPHQTKCCGNHACASCVENCKPVDGTSPCPICGQPNFRSERDKYVTRKVSQLRIRCQQNSRGCLWVGELITLKVHLMSCLYVEVPCPLKCGQRVLRRSLSSHQSQDCSKRFYKCEYCSFQGSFLQVTQEHVKTCDKIPIPCPNACSEDQVFERHCIQNHLSECPLEPVDCQFSYAGCTVRPQRRFLHSHLEEFQVKHLSLVSATVAGMAQELRKKDKQISTLLGTLEQQYREGISLKAEVRALRHDLNSWKHQKHTISNYCPYKFIVPRFEMMMGEDMVFYSAPFLSGCVRDTSNLPLSQDDRMILAVYPHGIGEGKGTHVSLCICVISSRGVLDSSQLFKGDVTINIIGSNDPNQSASRANGTDPDELMVAGLQHGLQRHSLPDVGAIPTRVQIFQPSSIITASGDSLIPSVEVDILPPVLSPAHSPAHSPVPTPPHSPRHRSSTFTYVHKEEKVDVPLYKKVVSMEGNCCLVPKFVSHADVWQLYLQNDGSMRIEVAQVRK